MKTYRRTVSPERAAQLRRIFADSGARFRQLGDKIEALFASLGLNVEFVNA